MIMFNSYIFNYQRVGLWSLIFPTRPDELTPIQIIETPFFLEIYNAVNAVPPYDTPKLVYSYKYQTVELFTGVVFTNFAIVCATLKTSGKPCFCNKKSFSKLRQHPTTSSEDSKLCRQDALSINKKVFLLQTHMLESPS